MDGDFQVVLCRVQKAGKLIVCMYIGDRNTGIIVEPKNAINGIKDLRVLHAWHWCSSAVVEGLGDAGHVGNIINKHDVHGEFPLVSGII